jgi:hypothetical protein
MIQINHPGLNTNIINIKQSVSSGHPSLKRLISIHIFLFLFTFFWSAKESNKEKPPKKTNLSFFVPNASGSARRQKS